MSSQYALTMKIVQILHWGELTARAFIHSLVFLFVFLVSIPFFYHHLTLWIAFSEQLLTDQSKLDLPLTVAPYLIFHLAFGGMHWLGLIFSNHSHKVTFNV